MSFNLAKPIIDIVVSVGVSAVVGNAIKATTPADINRYGKIVVMIGSIVASSAISDHASTYVQKQYDSIKDAFPKKLVIVESEEAKEDSE